jgi:hypothetical protein
MGLSPFTAVCWDFWEQNFQKDTKFIKNEARNLTRFIFYFFALPWWLCFGQFLDPSGRPDNNA